MLPNGNGKATAAAPQLTDEDARQVELEELPSHEATHGATTDTNDDIMQLARLGDTASIQGLFEAGKFGPTYCDEQGISPLHWAAINNRYATCQFLLKAGAEVNKKGGESVATPAMWAAQKCYYYTVNLLLEHGADPTITDVQGYNILHLATFEGNVFLLALLLHHGSVSVDSRDSHGHTALMWAAYKGLPACVDLFLRWGADVHAADDTAFTALHWALVKGSPGCIQKLVEYGADRFAKTSTGKTPAATAKEMHTERIWHKALREAGYKVDGSPKTLDFPLASRLLKDKRLFMKRFFFLWPFLIIGVLIYIISHMVVFAAIPIALVVGFMLQKLATQLLEYAPSDMRQIHKTPWLAGIFAGTGFWVGVRYITHIVPATYTTYPLTNSIFTAFYVLCAYFFFSTMAFEPGFVPKLGGLTQQKAVINELVSEWKFDDQNFCVSCMVRQPLRSKHCRRCGRCVAKHDHHCPWVNNCVGNNNHRHFFMYLITMAIGITILVRLTFGYFEQVEWGSSDCNVLAEDLCQIVNADTFTLVLVIWTALQMSWVTMLLFVQLVQISRAMTTYENMVGAHYQYGSRASEAITSVLTTGTMSREQAQLGASGLGPDPALPPTHAPGQHQHRGCFDQWKKILGVDNFVETLQGYRERGNRRRRNQNPFSRGCIVNCKDFWFDPAPLFGQRDNGQSMLGGNVVNYTMMYEPPSVTRARTGDDAGAYESVATDEVV